MHNVTRRIMATLVLIGLFLGVACTSSATPGSTSASPQASASSAPAASSGQAGSAKPSASAQPAANAEWDKVVAAAKQEGKVVVAGAPGDSYVTAVAGFKKAYPEIQLEFVGISGSEFAARAAAERDAGQYLWDIRLGGATSMLTTLRPKGMLAPIPPTLILPEVLDDSKWMGGFADGWLETDPQNKNLYMFEGRLQFAALVNRDIVPESQLNSVDQLLDPQWMGKLIIQDARRAGAAQVTLAWLVYKNGEDWVQKLLAQNPTVAAEARQTVESVIRGTTPVAIGLDIAELASFKKQGLGMNVKPLAPDSPAGACLISGFGTAALMSKAPHPNAQKVFINWLFTKEAQQAYVDATGTASRRLDVTNQPDAAPKPSVKYTNVYKEEFHTNQAKAGDIAKEMIK